MVIKGKTDICHTSIVTIETGQIVNITGYIIIMYPCLVTTS